MKQLLPFFLLLASQIYLTAHLNAQTSESWSWFTEAGAAPNNNLNGGIGIAMDAPANQQIFGELAIQTGASVGQSGMLLIGVKSNYPAVTTKGRKLVPFSIVAYGASVDTLLKTQLPPLGLSAASVTRLGTSAGFAQKYGGGFQTAIGNWNLGLGMSADKTGQGWKGYPFVFFSREFANPVTSKKP